MIRKILSGTFLLFSLLSSAMSHSWYSIACCSGQDCHPVPATEVHQNYDGSYTWNGFRFEGDMIKDSQDDRYHACVSEDITGAKTPHCLYRPRAGT